MAVPVAPKGCLLKLLIALIVIVVILAVAFVVLINLTPAQVGIADLELFDGNSLRDMGLADVKFKDLYKEIKAIMNPDESKIVQNGYSEEEETTNASENVNNSSIERKEDGTPDYSSIVKEPLTYDKEYLIEYNDTTLAYIFNAAIADASSNASSDGSSEGLEYLSSLNVDINEVTVSKSGQNYVLRIVASISLTSIKDEVKNALGGLSSIVSIPDRVYVVSYSTVTADENGKIVTTSDSLKINDADNKIADAIFKVLAKKANEAATEATGEGTKTDADYVNDKIGEGFSEFIARLGNVGTATVDNDKVVVSGTVELGAKGVTDHKITVITNTKATVEE